MRIGFESGEGSGRGRLGAAFSGERNSFNFLRLALAVVVIASHSIGVGLYGRDWVHNRTTWATIAVYGFFGISGFLIARSAERNSLGRFLWQRFLRIAPAFWVCLVVTAFGIGLLSWVSRSGHIAATYLNFHDGPARFVAHNALF